VEFLFIFGAREEKMNIFNKIKQEIIDIIASLKSENIIKSDDNISAITLDSSRDPTHGDMACNAAMILAKNNGMKPQELASIIASRITNIKGVVSAEVAGAGFINIKLKSDIWYEVIESILKLGKNYGDSDIGANERINLEYVSVNPTGPMHIGHARAAVFGDALAGLLKKCSYDVVKEYYINDAGNQIDVLAATCFLRYKEALGEKINTDDMGYPGEYLIDVGVALKEQYADKLLHMQIDERVKIIKEFAVRAMMENIRGDLSQMGIFHDIFTSEYKLHQEKKIDQALEILKSKDLIYRGILEAPKGKLLEDWEEREQLLFKSSQFGDDTDRALQKSDGSWTYFGAELAYVGDKLARGFKNLIMVLGADHGGYVKRTAALVKALSDSKAGIDIKLCQMVKFVKDGQPLKMSKRAGNYITVSDVVEMVGKDAIRFMMLIKKNDMALDFDVEKVREQSKDNPIFYVQYAHARCQSIIRLSTQKLDDNYQVLKKITSDAEIDLIKLLANWPKMVEAAAYHHEPHRIVFYLQELASSFHSLWNRGKDQKDMRFIIENDDELSKARLMMVHAVAGVIASGLSILSIEPVNEM
jgi:arginyl-tRNA synthetase